MYPDLTQQLAPPGSMKSETVGLLRTPLAHNPKRCLPRSNNTVEVPDIMRALEPELVDVLWQGIEPLLPAQDTSHPLGCHRPWVPDRLCFRAILIRLVTQLSDTTPRARRDEWIDAGVFEQLKAEALAGYDRIVGLDDVAMDGSLPKPPTVAKERARIPPVGRSWAGSGPCL